MVSDRDKSTGDLNAVLDRVASTVADLAEATIDNLRDPALAALTPAGRAALRARVSRAAIWVLSSIDDRATPVSIAAADLLDAPHHGVTAQVLSQACNDMCLRTWEALLADASQDESLLLVQRAARYLAAGTMLVQHVLTGAPTRAGRPPDRRPPDLGLEARRRQVAAALLRGERPPAVLSADDIPVATTYAVLVLQGSGQPARSSTLPPGCLVVGHPGVTGGATVLVPVRSTRPAPASSSVTSSADRRADATAQARQVFETLRRQDRPAGLAVAATIADIPAAVAEAREAVTTLSRLGRHEPGLYQLDDVLLEAALCRTDELTARLAGKLRPVTARNPYLLDTLAAFLDSDCERRELAQQLFIHPNTLNHRLRRVSELTGLSLTSARDLCVLKASLVAWRVVSENDTRPAARAA